MLFSTLANLSHSACFLSSQPHFIENLNGHTYEVASIAVSPDGKDVFSSSLDCTVKCWDQTKVRIATLVKSISFLLYLILLGLKSARVLVIN